MTIKKTEMKLNFQNINETKPTGSQIRFSIALGLIGLSLIGLGILWWLANAFGIAMGAATGANGFMLLVFSGLPLVIIGALCILYVPVVLHKKWLLYLLIGLIALTIVWFFQSE